MLKVKFDGQIEAPTFTGTTMMLAVADKFGNRYALLECGRTGQLRAWNLDTNENSVDCTIVQSFETTSGQRIKGIRAAGFIAADIPSFSEMHDEFNDAVDGYVEDWRAAGTSGSIPRITFCGA